MATSSTCRLAVGCEDGEDPVDLESERLASDALRALPRLGSEDDDNPLHLVSELGAGDAGEDLRAAAVYVRAATVYVRLADEAFCVEEDMRDDGLVNDEFNCSTIVNDEFNKDGLVDDVTDPRAWLDHIDDTDDAELQFSFGCNRKANNSPLHSLGMFDIEVWEHPCQVNEERGFCQEQTNPSWELSKLTSSNNPFLRELQIIGFRPLEQQLLFIKAVMERAPNLGTVVLKYDDPCEDCEAIGIFPPRSSTECIFPVRISKIE